jgi:hypothetical protein
VLYSAHVSYADLLIHDLLIKSPPPYSSPDDTGQLFYDSTGQPIGDTTVDGDDWTDAVAVRGLVQEMDAKWPEGPGAGPELVDTRIFLMSDAIIHELDKIRRTDVDPQQTYQAVFVHDAAGVGHHWEVQARRIPL